jgi:hypothetical protein
VKQRAKERYYRNREAILERAREHYRLKSAMGGSRRHNPSAKSVEAYLRHKERVKQRYYENKEQHLQRARDNYRKRKALSAEVSEALKVGRPLTPQQYEFWKKNQNLVEGKLKPGKAAKKKPKKTDIKSECMDIVNDLYKDKFTHIKLEQLQPSPQQQQQQQQQQINNTTTNNSSNNSSNINNSNSCRPIECNRGWSCITQPNPSRLVP